MAITREKKEEVVQKAIESLNNSKMTVLADYSGLSVPEMQELRAKLADNGSDIKVIKNNLFKIALSKSDELKEVQLDELAGSTAYVFGFEDEVAPAQAIVEFAKEHEAIELKGAFNAAGDVFSADQVKQLASLPSKDQLRGQVVGTIAAPLSGFVNVLSGNLRGLVNILNAVQDQKSNA